MKPRNQTLGCGCLLTLFAVSMAWTGSPQAAISFTHTTDLVTAAPSSRGVAAADFNRDGSLDLVLTGSEDATIQGSVSVFLGNGDGTFPQRATYPLPYGALAVSAADVNSDTFPDLAVGTIASYMLMLGNGDGSFAPATLIESIGIPFVSFADLNADGRPDIIASTASSVRIHLGNGDGTFMPAIEIGFPDCVYGEALHGDFNNDAHTDLAVIRCTDVVSVLLGNGDGTFQSPVDYRVTHGPNGGDVGDLNSDGRLDLVIANQHTSTVAVLMGNGDGTFTPGATIATGVLPIDAALGDLNSDQIPDLVAATYFGSTLEVSAGRGDGTFEPKIGYATGFVPSVVLGDWDRDGLLDIAASNWGGALPGSRISIFRNTPGVLAGASPVVTAPSAVTGNEGSLITFNVSAVDPDGDAISSLRALQLLDRGALPEGATFTPDAANTSGTFRWTPDFSAGGRSYDMAFVAQNALSASVRTSIFVGQASGPPIVTAPASVSGNEGMLITFTVSASDPDGDAITSLSAAPLPSGATFAANATNTSGTFSWTPSSLQTGSFNVTFTAANTLAGSATTLITIGCAAGQVIVDDFNDNTIDPSRWTIDQTGSGTTVTETNQRLEFTHSMNSANDGTGGFGITFLSVGQLTGDSDIQVDFHLLDWPYANGVRIALVTNQGTTEGATQRISFGTPSDFPGQPREVYATDFNDGAYGLVSTTDQSGKLRQVRTGNTLTGYYWGSGGWVAIHSAPVTVEVVSFGVASWSHDYAFTDQFVRVAFDNFIVNQGPFTTRAFATTNGPIRLASGKPIWCVAIEPQPGCYTVTDIDPNSIVLISPGTGSVSRISAATTKDLMVGDRDRNDIEDIIACFRKEDLRRLFSNVTESATFDVTVAGQLSGGGSFSASLPVEVIGSGGAQAASVYPNPLNPEGILAFMSPKKGYARVQLFDHAGRLVRTLKEGMLPAGYHEVRLDGRDGLGRPLASGIYFYRVKLSSATLTGRFTVLK